MLEAARDLVARLDAGEFGRLPKALLDLSPAPLRKVHRAPFSQIQPQDRS